MKFIYFPSLLFFLATLCSCNSTPKRESVKTYADIEAEFIATLTSADTTAVLAKAESLMEGLQKGELEKSLMELAELKGDSIIPISSQKLSEMVKHFQRFPVQKYRLTSYCFSIPELNDLKYSIEFAPANSEGYAPTISFMLNPIKVDNVWYLCVKDKEHSSKDMLHPIHPKTPITIR